MIPKKNKIKIKLNITIIQIKLIRQVTMHNDNIAIKHEKYSNLERKMIIGIQI